MLTKLFKNQITSWLLGFAAIGACALIAKFAIAYISTLVILTTWDIIVICFIAAAPSIYANMWLDEKYHELNPKEKK